jgi:hypothetical protein
MMFEVRVIKSIFKKSKFEAVCTQAIFSMISIYKKNRIYFEASMGNYVWGSSYTGY